MKRLVLLPIACLFFALLPSRAQAQIEDYDFAMGLADRSYFELATELLNDMMSRPGVSPADQAEAKLGLVGVQKRAADKETSGTEKIDKYREAAKGYDEFIAKYEDHPKFFDAIFEFGELLQSKGEAIGKLMEEEQDPDRVKELRNEGTEAIQEAQVLLQKAADFLAAQDPETRNENLYQKALFFRALNFYYVAALQAPGSFEKENNLKLAADELEDFTWTYEGTRAGWLALLYVGKANGERALENEDRGEEFASYAMDYLEGIVSRYQLDPAGDGVRDLWPDPWFTSLAQRAIYEQARIFNWTRRYPEAVETVQRLDELLTGPDGQKHTFGNWGFLAQLERINALESVDDMEKAIQVCQEMAKAAEGRGVGRVLARKLSELVDKSKGGAGGAQIVIPPDVLFTTARGFYDSQNWFRSIEYFQKVLAAIESTGDQKEKTPQTWNYIGKAYRKLNNPLAAAMAYEAGAKLSGFDKKDETVESNAFAAYGAYTQQVKLETSSKQGVTDFVRKAHLDMREYLTKTYEGTDLVYYAGVDELETGNVAGAIKQFEQVEKKSELLYPRSQAKLAECRLEMIKQEIEKAGSVTQDARKQLVAIDSMKKNFSLFTEDRNWQTGNVQAQEERKQAKAALDYYLAKANVEIGKADAAIAILSSFAETHSEQPNFVEAALYMKIEVQIDTDKLADAEKTTDELNEKFPKSNITSAAYLKIGQSYKQKFNDKLDAYAKSKSAESKDVVEEFIASDDAAKADLTKSSDFVKIWWDKQGRPFGKGLEIGNDYFRLAEYDKALEILEALYQRDKDNTKVSRQSRRALEFLLAETFLWHKKYKDAVPLYEQLYQRYIGDKKGVVNPDLRKNYAIALGGTAVLDRNNSVVEYDGIEDYAKAIEMWTPIAKSSQFKFTEIYWQAQFHIAYLKYKSGDAASAKRLVDNLTALYSDDLKDDPSGKLFDWLKRKF